MDGDKVERLRERLLVCPVCMDEFQDPRLLPCHHTMCSACILRLLRASSSGRFFRCPQCRRDVCVPRGGVAELPVNFFVRSLQDELGEEELDGVGPCQICQQRGGEGEGWAAVLSQFRCVDCDLDICRFCIHHHRLVLHKDASVVNILRMEVQGGPPSSLSPGGTANRPCDAHADELVQLFCETCQAPVCVSCSCDQHRKHVVEPLGKKLHRSRQHLQSQLESLSKERRGVKAWSRQLEGAQVEARDDCARTLAAVQRRKEELHGLVDKMASTLVDKVRQEERQQLAQLATCKEGLDTLAQRLDLGVGFLRGLQEGDVCLELIDAFHHFSSELDTVRQSALSKASVRVCQHEFRAGRHLHLGRLMAANFGLLRARYFFQHVGHSGSPPLMWRLWQKMTLFAGFATAVVVAMTYTVAVLASLVYHAPDSANVAALVFTVYLTLSVCFAFAKA